MKPISFSLGLGAAAFFVGAISTAQAATNQFVWDTGQRTPLAAAVAGAIDNHALGVVPDWLENFDSYVSGSQIHGQGGWKGWGNVASAGALVSSAQSVSPANSIAIAGGSDLVHEFSGYTDGVYVLSAKQFVPAGFAGESYFIVQNRYQDAMTDLSWSTQVVMDSAAMVIKNFDDPASGGVNPGSQPLVTGQWVDIALVIDLTADRQTFYYNGGVVFTGSWTAQYPITPPNTAGTLTIGAIDLYANNATVVFYDDIAIRSDVIFAGGFD